MKLFECQNCGQPLFFENTRCESCGAGLGYLPKQQTVMALQPDGEVWRALAAPSGRYRFCANAVHDVCNWLISANDPEPFCVACRHNRMIPNLATPDNLWRWRLIEVAKHRLFYTILKLRLPVATRTEDPNGLAFDFLEDGGPAAVMTGHDNGVITINLAEADDAERERRRGQMGEPYRTLLGHFRHEIAHYYWNRLIVNSPKLTQWRQIFGDDCADYGAALQAYYANGAPAGWAEHFVSAYASSHPWEDFAETWAHYFHMIDTLETANAFGLFVRPKLSSGVATKIDFDQLDVDMDRLIEGWLPLTFAVNSINRSMGIPDLYPFVLSPQVIGKLAFIHDCIREQAGRTSSPDGGLRAMIAGLRQRAGLPNDRSKPQRRSV
jgi:hypothetical protein